MEALVGLLRNMRRADTKSVELYIKKHEGFMIGVNRLDLRKMNPKYCQEHLDELKRKYNVALGSEEFVPFLPFRTLLVQILIAGLTVQDLGKVETKIAEYQAQILLHEREIEKAELLLKSIDVKDTIKQDSEMYNSSQFDFF